MHSRAREAVRIFIPIAVGLSALLMVSYINDQQILRMSANEPQKGMAEDLASGISNSATTSLPLSAPVAIESSLSPYLVVYDSYGNPISGNGFLEGQLPALPAGIFDVARGSGEDELTWQPEAGVRSAIAVVAINNGAAGFVMGGRSLRYIEYLEDQLTLRSLIGLIVVLIMSFIGSYFATYLRR